MFKNIVINRLKQYGQTLLHNNVKQDLDTVYYTAQEFVDKLPSVKKTFARNALDFLRNSIFEVAKMNKQDQNNGNKEVIDVEFKVKNKK